MTAAEVYVDPSALARLYIHQAGVKADLHKAVRPELEYLGRKVDVGC